MELRADQSKDHVRYYGPPLLLATYWSTWETGHVVVCPKPTSRKKGFRTQWDQRQQGVKIIEISPATIEESDYNIQSRTSLPSPLTVPGTTTTS